MMMTEATNQPSFGSSPYTLSAPQQAYCVSLQETATTCQMLLIRAPGCNRAALTAIHGTWHGNPDKVPVRQLHEVLTP